MKSEEFIKHIMVFRTEREWVAHPKDIAIALSLEAAELLEHFKWKTPEEVANYIPRHREEIEDEIMDVFFNAFLMVQTLGIDVDKSFMRKMEKNNKKYPVEKVKGKNPHL